MADQLEQRRETARALIEELIETRIDQMHEYLQLENNVHNLVHAINQLTLINNSIIDPALVAGEVAVEDVNAEEMEQARGVARQSVIETRNMIPQVINYINGENNLHNLHRAVNYLISINNEITNEALFAPPAN